LSSGCQQHPVGQICEIRRRCLARGNRLFQQLEASLLKGRVPIGVLREQPGSMRSLLSNQRAAGPAHSIDDHLQPRHISIVDSDNTPERILAATSDVGSSSLVSVASPQQFL
jgi:hypothetical protein